MPRIVHVPKTFPPSRRLRSGIEIRYVFRHGKRIRNLSCTLFYSNNDLGYARLGVVTSKRNQRKAIRRNQARRVVREAFRVWQVVLEPFDVVVVIQKQANQFDKKELRQCVESLFKRLSSG